MALEQKYEAVPVLISLPPLDEKADFGGACSIVTDPFDPEPVVV